MNADDILERSMELNMLLTQCVLRIAKGKSKDPVKDAKETVYGASILYTEAWT